MIDETVEEIREMQTHSSSVVAVKAARSLRELLDREYTTLDAFERDLQQNAGILRRANPSHASLHNAMRDITDRVIGETASIDEAKRLTADAIEGVIEQVESGKEAAAAAAADTFESGETILTHDYSSTVLGAIERVAEPAMDLTVYVTEARPRYLGRKTARALAELAGVEPRLTVDSAAGYLLPECDRVVVGMDCIVRDTLYNRVGTFPIAAAADNVGVPVDVVGSGAKLIAEGFQFENEQRPPSEISLEPIEGVRLENPAYDATPVELIERVITDEGVREPLVTVD